VDHLRVNKKRDSDKESKDEKGKEEPPVIFFLFPIPKTRKILFPITQILSYQHPPPLRPIRIPLLKPPPLFHKAIGNSRVSKWRVSKWRIEEIIFINILTSSLLILNN
jgi:hypothetical protein